MGELIFDMNRDVCADLARRLYGHMIINKVYLDTEDEKLKLTAYVKRCVLPGKFTAFDHQTMTEMQENFNISPTFINRKKSYVHTRAKGYPQVILMHDANKGGRRRKRNIGESLDVLIAFHYLLNEFTKLESQVKYRKGIALPDNYRADRDHAIEVLKNAHLEYYGVDRFDAEAIREQFCQQRWPLADGEYVSPHLGIKFVTSDDIRKITEANFGKRVTTRPLMHKFHDYLRGQGDDKELSAIKAFRNKIPHQWLPDLFDVPSAQLRIALRLMEQIEFTQPRLRRLLFDPVDQMFLQELQWIRFDDALVRRLAQCTTWEQMHEVAVRYQRHQNNQRQRRRPIHSRTSIDAGIYRGLVNQDLDGWKLVAGTNQALLVEWHERMRFCTDLYGHRIASGSSLVFALFDEQGVQDSCVEVRNKKVVQWRGYRNSTKLDHPAMPVVARMLWRHDLIDDEELESLSERPNPEYRSVEVLNHNPEMAFRFGDL